MDKIGILGGTFDPIHHGHLITARALLEIRNLSKVIFVPAFISPHKKDKVHSDPIHRLNMLKIATEQIPYFDYSTLEIERKEISYTIDTLREIKNHHHSLELIIGFDNIEKFYTWKNPDEILKIARLVVMEREVHKDFPKDKYFDSATFVKTPAIDITATNIRERVKNNLPIDFLVPEKVKKYIYQYNLYK